jgi:GTP-binding protein
MHISQATFAGSSTTLQQCPHSDKPAFAFIGRSNVGKSTLINRLLNRKRLAKTSSTPGKTQLINHFLVNEAWCLVDLPGYGWARASKVKKVQWQAMVRNYLCHSSMLVSVFLLIDARHMPQPIDTAFVHWLGENQIPCAIVFTKADKCTLQRVQSHVAAFQKTMLLRWQELPPFFITSATQSKGHKELLLYIQKNMPQTSL